MVRTLSRGDQSPESLSAGQGPHSGRRASPGAHEPHGFKGNNENLMKGLKIGARTCLDQGRLCVYVLHQTGRWGSYASSVTCSSGKGRRPRILIPCPRQR